MKRVDLAIRALTHVSPGLRLVVAGEGTAGVSRLAFGPDELAEVTRHRLDPFGCRMPVENRRSLAQLVDNTGTDTEGELGPMALDTAWDHVRVDRTFHQTMAITEWPRLDVAANWMEPAMRRRK